jgi:hypothetical protein
MANTARFAAFAAAALLSACATTGGGAGPVDVTRFHLGTPIARESVSVQSLNGFAGISPEDQLYANAIAAELTPLGFAPTTASGAPSTLIAAFAYKRTSQGTVRKRPPVTIGIGGGSFGGNVGVGGGASFGIGGGRAELIATELSVQIKRRTDNTIIWEGRAVTEALGQGGEPGITAQRLAHALFKGFPGESGITITVK